MRTSPNETHFPAKNFSSERFLFQFLNVNVLKQHNNKYNFMTKLGIKKSSLLLNCAST